MLDIKKGAFLVMLARSSICDFVNRKDSGNKCKESWLSEKKGAFVTIETYPGRDLRGCIGFAMPVRSLGEAVHEAARMACCDSRFSRLEKDEIDKILLEVSVLSKPRELKAAGNESILEKINENKDGLIIEYGLRSGLFLPQVWQKVAGKEDFLDALCMKASIPPGYWKSPDARFFCFRTQIFKEEKPWGKIVEEKM